MKNLSNLFITYIIDFYLFESEIRKISEFITFYLGNFSGQRDINTYEHGFSYGVSF